MAEGNEIEVVKVEEGDEHHHADPKTDCLYYY